MTQLLAGTQAMFESYEQEQIKAVLGKNYTDYLFLRSQYEGGDNFHAKRGRGSMVLTEEVKEESGVEAMTGHFIYLQEADFAKPIWTSYCDRPEKIETLANYMPFSMQKILKRSMPTFESNHKISIGIELLGLLELPSFGQGKRLTAPGSTTINDLIEFLNGKVNFEKHIICLRDVPFEP